MTATTTLWGWPTQPSVWELAGNGTSAATARSKGFQLAGMRACANSGKLFTVPTSCLIVDDNAIYLGEARRLLQRQGMRVVGVASNLEEAIAIADADRPDVALVDVDLGPESGLDVAAALAKSNAPMPVIMISAYAEADLRDLLDGSPAVGFLPKSSLSRAAIDDLLRDAHDGTN